MCNQQFGKEVRLGEEGVLLAMLLSQGLVYIDLENSIVSGSPTKELLVLEIKQPFRIASKGVFRYILAGA